MFPSQQGLRKGRDTCLAHGYEGMLSSSAAKSSLDTTSHVVHWAKQQTKSNHNSQCPVPRAPITRAAPAYFLINALCSAFRL